MNELMIEMQAIEQQLQQMQQQLEAIDQKVEEAKELKKNMAEFKELEEGSEILVPVNNGIFARAKLLDSKNLKVNVGSGVIVGKSAEDTAKMMDEQIIQLKKLKEKASEDFDKLVKKGEVIALKIRDSENVQGAEG